VNEFGREHFAHTLEGDVDRTAQWEDVFDSIGRIKRLADSIHADFLLTTYPWAHQLGDTGWVPGRYAFMEKGERTSDLTQKTIRQRSAALGIDLFEALPVFERYQGSEPLYFDYDPHLSVAGQKVLAEGLGRYIAEHQLPRWCAGK
jgi:hypothetical protein